MQSAAGAGGQQAALADHGDVIYKIYKITEISITRCDSNTILRNAPY
jgi:hypothetical protein